MSSFDRLVPVLTAVRRLLDEHGIPSHRLEAWKDGSNLLVRPANVPLILRVATFTGRVRGDPLPYLAREVALVGWLHEHGAPVMGLADVMPPGPFLADGWGVAAFAFVEHRPGVIPSPAAALDALEELRAVLRVYPGELPEYGPAAADLDLAFGFARRAGVLDEATVEGLRLRRDNLLARLRALDPSLEPQHGDAFPRNTVTAVGGRVTWIDLEDACMASPSWDLAVMVRNTDDAGVRRRAEERVGADVLEAAVRLREVQADVWTALHDARARRGW
jgi:hypothetical protein